MTNLWVVHAMHDFEEQSLNSDFVFSGIVKVSVSVISFSFRLD